VLTLILDALTAENEVIFLKIAQKKNKKPNVSIVVKQAIKARTVTKMERLVLLAEALIIFP